MTQKDIKGDIIKPMRTKFSKKISLLSKSLIASLLILTPLFTPSSSAGIVIDCESLINKPVKETPEEEYKKGYCYIKLGKYGDGVRLLKGLETTFLLLQTT